MKNYTDITILLDRSGSMQSIKNATVLAFNSFLLDQKKGDAKAKLSLIQFDDKYEVNYTAENIKDAKGLNEENFIPRGMTALYDSMGTMITQTKARLKQEKVKPSKVLVVILTDGMENASREYSCKQIYKKITKLEEKKHWHFIYLAANQDAIIEGEKFGIKKNKAMTFKADAAGISKALHTTSFSISNYCKSKDFSLVSDNEEDITVNHK